MAQASLLYALMIVPVAKIQVRRDEDGVRIAKSNLLPSCHADGHDRGEALLRFQEAAKAHLEALLQTGQPIPISSVIAHFRGKV